MTFADDILNFLRDLRINASLPPEVIVLNPYREKETFDLCSLFFKKYYDDDHRRTLILGINPGRHGAGVTGIPFTDPVKLEKYCGIANTMPRKTELSADFIYAMINAYGGPVEFYKKFYFSAVSPLGFTKDGKNLNYYDNKELQFHLREFIVDSMRATLEFGIDTSVCYCLGEGENFKFLNRLNQEFNFFGRIIPLAHPRFIMQYRRRKIDEYISEYLSKLRIKTI